MEPSFRSSPLALAVLSLLEVGPLHPYGMQRLIKQWGKDQVINVGNRANLYKTIKRLDDAGLVAVRQTERDQLYPERTVYELTDEGRRASRLWLLDMLTTDRKEYPDFPAALSFAMLVPPDTLRAALGERAAELERSLKARKSELALHSRHLPRVVLLDDEHAIAVDAARLRWMKGVIEDLRTGALTWDEALLGASIEILPDGTEAG